MSWHGIVSWIRVSGSLRGCRLPRRRDRTRQRARRAVVGLTHEAERLTLHHRGWCQRGNLGARKHHRQTNWTKVERTVTTAHEASRAQLASELRRPPPTVQPS